MVGAVTEFAPEILRLVTGLLAQPVELLIKHQQLEKGLYCVEQLAETLDEEQLEKLLPSLLKSMQRFMEMGNSGKCDAATLAVSALGVIIATAQDAIGPHLNECVQMLQGLLPTSASTGWTKFYSILTLSEFEIFTDATLIIRNWIVLKLYLA